MAKEHAEVAPFTLVEIATGDGAGSAGVSAAVAILDRAYGKPSQALEHSTPDNSLQRLMAELTGTTFRLSVRINGDPEMLAKCGAIGETPSTLMKGAAMSADSISAMEETTTRPLLRGCAPYSLLPI